MKKLIQNRVKICTEQIKSCLPFLLLTALVEERKDLEWAVQALHGLLETRVFTSQGRERFGKVEQAV